MKIAIFTDSYLPKIDGVAISTDLFCRRLAERGFQFVIFCPRYGDSDIVSHPQIRTVRFGGISLPSYRGVKGVLPAPGKIKRILGEFNPDLIHIQTPGFLGLYGIRTARRLGLPFIASYHTLIFEQETYLSLYRLLKLDRLHNALRRRSSEHNRHHLHSGFRKRLLLKLYHRLFDRARLIITPSQSIRSFLLRERITTQIEVISNGLDLDRFNGTAKRAPQRAPRLLHVGRISHEKNCQVLLHALAIIARQHPDCTLDIVGEGPAVEYCRTETRLLGLEARVRFFGLIEREELPALYREHDLFLTASTMETQGLVVLEAISCGLPCIGVDAFALPDLIRDGENGFICPPFDHRSIAQKTLELLGDPKLYRRFSAAGLRLARHHDIRRSVKRLGEVYRSLERTG